MSNTKTPQEWMTDRGLKTEELVQASALQQKVVEAILHGRYTPSPQQRQKIAAALKVSPEEISWGHLNEVSHVYGHGPQFGRSP